MTDSNLIMDKIRNELHKALPSKRKILSNLVDLLNKDKYPSLSDVEFYDIVGETYKLNLDYKLNLKLLFYPIYNGLKKKIKKLYGKEKTVEMEQYLIKYYGLFGTDHILNKIKKEFEQTPPKDLNLGEHLSLKILTIFSNLLSKEEYQDLSDSDFHFIVGETFKLNPEFFMDSLYRDLRKRMEKKNRLIMDKYIVEKYSLIDEEHIIYEFNGNIKFADLQNVKPSGGLKFGVMLPASASVTLGSIFLTNYRLIAQGMLDTKAKRNPFWGIFVNVLTPGGYRAYGSKKIILESSLTFGYQFPTRNHIYLKKKRNGVSYSYIQDNQFKLIEIKLNSKTSQAKREEQINTIFQILSKDVNHIKDTIKVILEMELKNKWKTKEIAVLLLSLRVTKEYYRLTDSEYTDIVETTYKMNPQFFMTHIYPQIKSIKQQSIEPMKKDLIKLIENLNLFGDV